MVPKGSVGIAAGRPGSIPLNRREAGRSSAGPKGAFTPDDETPCFFAPGDHVKFYQVEEV